MGHSLYLLPIAVGLVVAGRRLTLAGTCPVVLGILGGIGHRHYGLSQLGALCLILFDDLGVSYCLLLVLLHFLPERVHLVLFHFDLDIEGVTESLF